MHRKTPRFTNSAFVVNSGARVGELKRENNVHKETVYLIVVSGELLSVEELRRLDRRFAQAR